jgi:hypothetical protein
VLEVVSLPLVLNTKTIEQTRNRILNYFGFKIVFADMKVVHLQNKLQP